MSEREVYCNDRGYPVGEKHHSAKLRDIEVDLIRELHDTGVMGYARIARVFGVHKNTICVIVRCITRYQQPTRVRRVA